MSLAQSFYALIVGWGLVGEPADGMLVLTANGVGIDVTGYNESDYWDDDGMFLGPDCHGVTPVYDWDGLTLPEEAKPYPYKC